MCVRVLPFRALPPSTIHVRQLRLGAQSLLSTSILFSKPTHPSPGAGRVERWGWGSSALIPIVSSSWSPDDLPIFPSSSRLAFTPHYMTTSPLGYILPSYIHADTMIIHENKYTSLISPIFNFVHAPTINVMLELRTTTSDWTSYIDGEKFWMANLKVSKEYP